MHLLVVVATMILARRVLQFASVVDGASICFREPLMVHRGLVGSKLQRVKNS